MAKAPNRVDRQQARRDARREANRTEILDAAERVFAHEGIRAASIRSIAAEAGFSAAALYLFFENRHHLAAETITRRGDELNALLDTTVAAAADPLDALHCVIDVTLEFFAQRDDFRQLLRELRGDLTMIGPVLSEYAPEVDQRLRFAQELLTGVIEAGQASGRIRPDNPHVLAHLYMVLVNELVYLRVQPGMDLSTESFHAIVDGALGTRRAAGKAAKRS